MPSSIPAWQPLQRNRVELYPLPSALLRGMCLSGALLCGGLQPWPPLCWGPPAVHGAASAYCFSRAQKTASNEPCQHFGTGKPELYFTLNALLTFSNGSYSISLVDAIIITIHITKMSCWLCWVVFSICVSCIRLNIRHTVFTLSIHRYYSHRYHGEAQQSISRVVCMYEESEGSCTEHACMPPAGWYATNGQYHDVMPAFEGQIYLWAFSRTDTGVITTASAKYR